MKRDFALLVDGTCLSSIFSDDDLSCLLQSIFVSCTSVTVFRCSPDDKAKIISFTNEKDPSAFCCSIGDGANDVNMIQTARIGVGIEGNEGNQAAYFADYSLPEFQGLRRLIMWHGRSFGLKAYSVFIPQAIFKGQIYMATMFWPNWFNGFSGMNIYTHFYQSLYPVSLTNFDTIFFALFSSDG